MQGPHPGSTWNDILNLYEQVRLARASAAQGTKPLVRTKFVDYGTTTPAASADGSIGNPYATLSAYMTALGNNASVNDANAQAIAWVSPFTQASMTENVTVPAYRNVMIRGISGIVGDAMVGNVTWANTAAAGGVNAGSAASLVLHNWAISGNFTYTDDAGAPATEIIVTNDEIGSSTAIVGNLTATGGTKLAILAFNNASVGGNVVSTANATGAAITGITSTFAGAVTGKSASFTQCVFDGGGSNVITVNSGSTVNFVDCSWTAGGSIVAGTTGTITFDGQSWASFRESGGTITSGIVLVVGGASQGTVLCPPTGAPTSIGDQSVNISLNGTGATNAGGFNGTLGGNTYIENTALGAGRTVTVKTGGGEKTGDTILVSRIGPHAGVGAFTLTINNNAGTTLTVLPASVGGFALVQFNTVVANDWGLLQAGSGPL